mgnify:CR=1 FL=1
MSALIVDIILWGSVAALGLMAWQRGRPVLVSSVREGTLDFINIVPRIALGLDQPLHIQFYRYVTQLLKGDFGTSVMTSNPVTRDIATFFPATFELDVDQVLRSRLPHTAQK